MKRVDRFRAVSRRSHYLTVVWTAVVSILSFLKKMINGITHISPTNVYSDKSPY